MKQINNYIDLLIKLYNNKNRVRPYNKDVFMAKKKAKKKKKATRKRTSMKCRWSWQTNCQKGDQVPLFELNLSPCIESINTLV